MDLVEIQPSGLAQFRPRGENGRVFTLTEPQVWTLIGVFGAAMFGIQGIAISSFRREIKSLGEGIRAELSALRNDMNALFEVVNNRLDNLDRDVQFLMRKEFE
jgi:hypothetical protein